MQRLVSSAVKRVAPLMGHHLVLAAVRKYTLEMCEGLGAENVTWCIQNEKTLAEFVTDEKLKAMREWAAQYAGMDKIIPDAEFWTVCIPEWTRDLVTANGEKGARWFYSTVALIRSAFNPEPAKGGA